MDFEKAVAKAIAVAQSAYMEMTKQDIFPRTGLIIHIERRDSDKPQRTTHRIDCGQSPDEKKVESSESRGGSLLTVIATGEESIPKYILHVFAEMILSILDFEDFKSSQ